MMQEAYTFTVKPKGQAKDKWDFLQFGPAVPRAEPAAGAARADERAERVQDVGGCRRRALPQRPLPVTD